MTVLDRSELQASPLADLYTVAAQVGLEGYRRMRKAELIDAILTTLADDDAGSSPGASTDERGSTSTEERGSTSGGAPPAGEDQPATPDRGVDDGGQGGRGSIIRRRRFSRARRGRSVTPESPPSGQDSSSESQLHRLDASTERDLSSDSPPPAGGFPARGSEPSGGGWGGSPQGATERTRVGGFDEEIAEGVVELQGNGSAFLRVGTAGSSTRDIYVSAGQVRRCELVSGDRVTGPIRPPRRSERYPSLVRVDAINGTPASSQEDVQRYEDLPVSYPTRRLALGSEDPTLKAIEWLTPIGLGSRALIAGAARAGKTETLHGLLGAIAGRDDLEVMLVLSGVRPEEASTLWQGVGVEATITSTLGASADAQGQALERAVETAQRMAVRGTDVVVAIDTLDGLHPHVARKILAGARNLRDAGSLTIIATAARPLGGETTVITLDVAMTSTGRFPALDLGLSGSCKPELLVGEDGAKAIVAARAAALER